MAATLLPLLNEVAHAALLYERAAILDGQLWRLFTGHFVHFGPRHWAWDVAVALVAGVWLERRAPSLARRFWWTAPLAVSLALLAFDPALEKFGGLSGLGTGLVAMLALVLSAGSSHDRATATAIATLLATKLVAEWMVPGTLFVPFDNETVRAAPLAHAAGVAWGWGCFRWSLRVKARAATGATEPNRGR